MSGVTQTWIQPSPCWTSCVTAGRSLNHLRLSSLICGSNSGRLWRWSVLLGTAPGTFPGLSRHLLLALLLLLCVHTWSRLKPGAFCPEVHLPRRPAESETQGPRSLQFTPPCWPPTSRVSDRAEETPVLNSSGVEPRLEAGVRPLPCGKLPRVLQAPTAPSPTAATRGSARHHGWWGLGFPGQRPPSSRH